MRGSNPILPALAALTLLALSGLARAAPCEQRSPTVFALSGETNPAMADCVTAKLRPTKTELVVDSPGGPSGVAMDIAERLSSLDVSAYETWLKSQLTPERIARLKKQRIAGTGTIVCNGQGW